MIAAEYGKAIRRTVAVDEVLRHALKWSLAEHSSYIPFDDRFMV